MSLKIKRNFSPNNYATGNWLLISNTLRVRQFSIGYPGRGVLEPQVSTKSDKINRVSIDANKRCCMLDLTTHTNLSYQAGSGILHGIVNGTSCRQRPPRCTKNKIKTALIKTANISFFSWFVYHICIYRMVILHGCMAGAPHTVWFSTNENR